MVPSYLMQVRKGSNPLFSAMSIWSLCRPHKRHQWSIVIANPRKRVLEDKDYKSFTLDPTTLLDKQFILEEGEGKNTLFQVTELRFRKGSRKYLVQFEGCIDSVTKQRPLAIQFHCSRESNRLTV
jgi:hypothetical protein